MITRIWHGWTTPDDADAYERIVSTKAIPGFLGSHLLLPEG